MGGMTASESIGIARREVTRAKAQRIGWIGKFAKLMSKPIRGNSTSPRAHTFHAMKDKHEHNGYIAE